MTVIPIGGRNTRLGKLFKTPKHLLLYLGVPAICHTVKAMRVFGEVVIICRPEYYPALEALDLDATIKVGLPTDNPVDTILQAELTGDLWIVDCDVIPLELTKPLHRNTIFLFRNLNELPDHSNYNMLGNVITDCNEKGKVMLYAGAGVYYFSSAEAFKEKAKGGKSVGMVAMQFEQAPLGDDQCSIFRFGTLADITNP